MADIVINASPSKALAVELVGKEYQVRPPKMAVLAVVANAAGGAGKKKGKEGADTLKRIEDLVKIMFRQDSKEVLERLNDPEDELDYQQIMDAAEAVIEAQTGNPTSSPQGSSKS